MAEDFASDIAAVQRIAAVPSILDIVCRSTGMGFAAVARVTEDRWIACQVLDSIHFGLPAGGELKVETTLCHEVRQLQKVIVFDHAEQDPEFCDHHTVQHYRLQSYISVPIILPDGRFFGTLCAIDPAPHKVNTPEIIGAFKLFAELIAYHLDAEDRLSAARSDLVAERKTAEFREQFIAVLGHDLRNPLAALDAGAGMLLRDGWTDRAPAILRLMRASIKRSQALVENVMDLARARLGGGIALHVEPERDLLDTLIQVVDEMRSSHPDRFIETHFQLGRKVAVDHTRIGQLLSNLLGNAISHGATDAPIRVSGLTNGDELTLSVSNSGAPIPPAARDRLFQPFYRADVSSRQGLGLGLYIASEIAVAHGGEIQYSSDENETRFSFRMPITGRVS